MARAVPVGGDRLIGDWLINASCDPPTAGIMGTRITQIRRIFTDFFHAKNPLLSARSASSALQLL